VRGHFINEDLSARHVFIWVVPEFLRLRKFASSHFPSSLHSPSGFTSRCANIFNSSLLARRETRPHGHQATNKAAISQTSRRKCATTANNDSHLAVRAVDLTLPAPLKRRHHPPRRDFQGALAVSHGEPEASQSSYRELQLRWKRHCRAGSHLWLLGLQA
jgi:hypothetical protein